jgi:integrase
MKGVKKMASVKKVDGKKGISYEITVCHGKGLDGKAIRTSMTWKPPPKMTKKQTEKELDKIMFEFEKKIRDGFDVNNKQTFAEYAEYVLELKERTGVKHRTLEYYREMLGRINDSIGYLKLADIRPQHLNNLYANLGERGIRRDGHKATPKAEISSVLKEKGYTQIRLANEAQISEATVAVMVKGKRVNLDTAKKIATVLSVPIESLFTVEINDEPLSDKTVLEHHRLISTVLRQAEKEMIVQYNAAARATPPKVQFKEAACFQPEEVDAILEALENEPIKWKLYTHLLLASGGRRGEIAGLPLKHIDWKNNIIEIKQALLYSKTKGVYVAPTKTSAVRFIELPGETMEIMYEYKEWYDDLKMKNCDRWQDSGYLFVQDNGAHMHPDSINDWLREFAVRHKLPHINPHKLRHTNASILYFNYMDDVSVSKRMGHANPNTTRRHYAHFINKANEIASSCIANSMYRRNTAEKNRQAKIKN